MFDAFLTLITTEKTLLPLIFGSLMGISILVYVILDGFDLGVGILSAFVAPHERNHMIESIGPFWDANETWLVLAVGLLLVAFPMAHGYILTTLYLPVFFMLIGLILRGVAFEFRHKGPEKYKRHWEHAFFAGSLLTALCQGFMLGEYIMGFKLGWAEVGFSLFTALVLVGGYVLMGSGWLIWRSQGLLRLKMARWMRISLLFVGAGLGLISLATPFVSERIYEKWFSFPSIVYLAPLPLLTLFMGWRLWRMLCLDYIHGQDQVWQPFATASFIFFLSFLGLAYSFYPYVVPEKMTIFQAASATDSLRIMLYGALLVLPIIFGYTIYAYRVFLKKGAPISY